MPIDNVKRGKLIQWFLDSVPHLSRWQVEYLVSTPELSWLEGDALNKRLSEIATFMLTSGGLNWIENAQQQTTEADYLSLYDPETGRSRVEEQARRNQIQQSLSESSTARGMANVESQKSAELMQRYKQFQKQQPSMPSYTAMAYPFLESAPKAVSEKISTPNLRRYWEQNQPNWGQMLSTAYTNIEPARQAWWKWETAWPSEETYPAKGSREGEAFKDPWAQYLKSFPSTVESAYKDIEKQYKELGPQERGQYPSQYQPMTRWLNY